MASAYQEAMARAVEAKRKERLVDEQIAEADKQAEHIAKQRALLVQRKERLRDAQLAAVAEAEAAGRDPEPPAEADPEAGSRLAAELVAMAERGIAAPGDRN